MSTNKIPVQIYLCERQNQALQRLSKGKNISVSKLVRQGIDLLLRQIDEQKPAYHLIGLGDSGVTNIAEKHDEHITREIEKERK